MTPTFAMSSSNSFHISVSNSFCRIVSGSGGGDVGDSGGNSSSSSRVFCRLDIRLLCRVEPSSPVESCLENIEPLLVALALPIGLAQYTRYSGMILRRLVEIPEINAVRTLVPKLVRGRHFSFDAVSIKSTENSISNTVVYGTHR